MERHPSFPIRPLWLAVVVIAFAVGGSVSMAKADLPPPPAQREFREPDAGEPLKLVTIAIYLLVAVTVAIVSLLILVMVWGARVRRQARRPLPSTSPNDPLWYLKGKKSKLTEPNRGPGVSESKEVAEHDAEESSSPDDADEPPSA